MRTLALYKPHSIGLYGRSFLQIHSIKAQNWQWCQKPYVTKPISDITSRLIREFFPKGTDFSRVTDEEVQEVFEKINDRPRKVLGFRTANEVYREMLHSA